MPDDLDEDSLSALSGGQAATPNRPDPAVLLAHECLRAAAGRRSLSRLHAAHPVVLVTVPGRDWVQPTLNAWRDFAWGGREGTPSPGGGRRREYGERPAWVGIELSGSDWQASRRSPDREVVSEAVLAGLPLLVVAVGGQALPPELVATADLRLDVCLPSWAAVCRVAGCMGEGMVSGVTRPAPVILEAITPTLMRLALRPGQSADSYLAKLVALAASTLPMPAASDAPLTPGLDSLPGLGEALAWGRRLAADLRDYKAGALAWADVDRGVVLSGPPGCGKTSFARALAAECGVPLVVASYAQWQSSGDAHLGCLLKAMRASFAQARKSAPSILFIDEVDSFPNRESVRHSHADYVRSFVNALLAELDGAVAREGVVVVGACNNPDVLDLALVRSGRLERHVVIPLPDAAARDAILRVHLGVDLRDADLAVAVEMSEGRTGADVERWCREARRAARLARRAMTLDDLESAIAEGQRDTRSPAYQWLVAVHEAGHAVAGLVLGVGVLERVSIRAVGIAAGYAKWTMPDLSAASPAVVRAMLVQMLAGRAAEEVLLGQASAGAGGTDRSDLARATWLATLEVTAFGFDPDAGLAWLGCPEPGEVPGLLVMQPDLARCVRERLDVAHAEARALVTANRSALVAVAEEITVKQTLTGAQVMVLVSTMS